MHIIIFFVHTIPVFMYLYAAIYRTKFIAQKKNRQYYRFFGETILLLQIQCFYLPYVSAEHPTGPLIHVSDLPSQHLFLYFSVPR